MHPALERTQVLSRRHFFGRTATGIGSAALAALLTKDGFAANPEKKRIGGLPAFPHFAPKAKRVIYLFQNGAPTHVDLFDYKPELTKRKGEQIPDSVVKGARFSTMTSGQTVRPCLPEITKFKQHGQGGAWVSDFLPHTAAIADDLCFVKSMYTTQVNHAPAICFFLTGSEMPGRPSMGAWLTYGLGVETEDLPGFVAMTSRDKEASCGQIFYDFYWGSGFLPTRFQGVKFRGSGDPVLYLSNPDGQSRESRRASLDDLNKLNELTLKEFGDTETATRIAQYEMAYRMQMSVPELTDFTKEPLAVLESYGPDVKKQGSFAYNCLMARRLIERGTRFVQLLHAGWDQHRNLNTQLKVQCTDTDGPSAALVKDLKRLGLLDDTLVIWGGEFGRTPFLQGDIKEVKSWGRDHHPYVFTVWMAGGGVKKGTSYGESDDFGFAPAKDAVHIHDFQATILHLLGIDHTKLTFRFQGRDYRLTDVHGNVVKGLLGESDSLRNTVANRWMHYFPVGSLDTRADLHRMKAEWFADALERLEELSLYPSKPNQPLTIRLLCLPTWLPACSVRAELFGLSWRLFARELDGEEAGFDLGNLLCREERIAVGADAEQISKLWVYLRFWQIAATGRDDVLDGTTYFLEAAENGPYRAVVRDDPEWGDTFGELSDLLIGLGGLNPR